MLELSQSGSRQSKRDDTKRTGQAALCTAPKADLQSRPAVIEATIRDAENDIVARVSERLESQSDPLTPASAAAIARELMHI